MMMLMISKSVPNKRVGWLIGPALLPKELFSKQADSLMIQEGCLDLYLATKNAQSVCMWSPHTHPCNRGHLGILDMKAS